MKIKKILDEIPEKFLRILAKQKGYLPGRGESIDEIKEWLLEYYKKAVTEITEKSGNIVDLAGETIKKIKSAVGLAEREENEGNGANIKPSEYQEKENAVFFTPTMAKIYERQGLFEDAAIVYRKLLENDPNNPRWINALKRIGMYSEESISGIEDEKEGVQNVVRLREIPRQKEVITETKFIQPAFRGDTIVLMKINPGRFYVYWEVGGESIRKIRKSCDVREEGELILRIFRILQNENRFEKKLFRDEPATSLSGERFLEGLEPGGFYNVSIGLKIKGDFFGICNSNLVESSLPINETANEDRFMEIDQKKLIWQSKEISLPRILMEKSESGYALSYSKKISFVDEKKLEVLSKILQSFVIEKDEFLSSR